MRFTQSVDIARPIGEVVAVFDDPDNMICWQEGLQSYELLDGVMGEPGARMQLNYRVGDRQFHIIEMLESRNLPEEMVTYYETQGVINRQRNRFEQLGPLATRWVSENEFVFDTFVMKLLGWLVPGVFRKQSLKVMNDFKRFAETGKGANA